MTGPLDVLAVMDAAADRAFDDADHYRHDPAQGRELRQARAAVAELVRRSLGMLDQDQCRFATYNTAPHMATAVDNLRAALAKFVRHDEKVSA